MIAKQTLGAFLFVLLFVCAPSTKRVRIPKKVITKYTLEAKIQKDKFDILTQL
jgi:hypothetical protein